MYRGLQKHGVNTDILIKYFRVLYYYFSELKKKDFINIQSIFYRFIYTSIYMYIYMHTHIYIYAYTVV